MKTRLLLIALVLLQVTPVLAQERTEQPVTYVVEAGDTLYSIALRFGVTVEAIATANGIADPTLITVGQKLVIPLEMPPAVEPSRADIYVIQPGDTLSAIAVRFGTTVAALAEANGIADPTLIVAGQELLIPGSLAEQAGWIGRRVHPVRPGESLPFLAFRYGTTTWALRVANALNRLGLLYPGQELTIPPAGAVTVATPRYPGVEVSPSPAVQGQTVSIEVQGTGRLDLRGSWQGRDLQIADEDGRYSALLGIDALTEPGLYPVILLAREYETGDLLTLEYTLIVTAGEYPVYDVPVPASRQSLLDPTLTRDERELVAAVFGQISERRLWEGAFAYPLTGEPRTTAPFGQRRSYAGGPVSSYHTGQDFGADSGTPILAPAAGQVMLAEPLQVRGQAVILDHGLGVFSGFWHLSRIDVEVGQSVDRGEALGLVGNTGLSTGPHLHWEVRVSGVPVDPLQWTRRAFP